MPSGAVAEIVKSVVPISRFNRGEASKIFDEVKKDGIKVVMKNNDPSCVLVSMDRYLELEEQLENYRLAFEAIRREKDSEGKSVLEHSAVLTKFGYSEEELAENDVEIE